MGEGGGGKEEFEVKGMPNKGEWCDPVGKMPISCEKGLTGEGIGRFGNSGNVIHHTDRP